MAKIKLILDRRRQGNDGTYPVSVLVSHRHRTSTWGTGINVRDDQWDDSSAMVVKHRRAQELNRTLLNILDRWESALLRLRESGDTGGITTAVQLKDILLSMAEKKEAKGDPANLFLTRFTAYTESRATPGTRRIYGETIRRMRDFDPQLAQRTFEDIDLKWLRDFDRFMARTSPSANARAIKFRNIRAVFNEALDDEVTSAYPFRKFKIKHEQTRKRSLTPDQLRLLITTEVEPHLEKYRDMFVLMFCLCGINAVDLLNASPDQVRDGRLEYRRAKTGRLYSVRVEPEAAELIERYRGTRWLLNVRDTYPDYLEFLRHMNRELKHIGPYTREGRGGKKVYRPLFPDISQYWCRHTWATIAAGLDIPKETIAAALGHSIGNPTTSIYIDFNQGKVDEANRRVLDFVFGQK